MDIDCGYWWIETRKCSVINNFERIEDQDKLKIFKTILWEESTREFKNSGNPKKNAGRYYITSLTVKATEF